MSDRSQRTPSANRALTHLATIFLAVVLAACSSPPEVEEGGETTATPTTAPAATATQPEVLMPAPDVTGIELRNQNDEPVSFASLRGKPTLLTFIYTRCPMPEMCPATTLRFQEVQTALSADERADVRLISVSFDPAYDTPEVLAEYGELWEVDDTFWSLLTGDEDDIQRLAAAYGVWYEQDEDGTYRHPMYSLVLFPDGALHQVLLGSAWDSDEVADLLRDMAADTAPSPH
jgi:protein SCO1/2